MNSDRPLEARPSKRSGASMRVEVRPGRDTTTTVGLGGCLLLRSSQICMRRRQGWLVLSSPSQICTTATATATLGGCCMLLSQICTTTDAVSSTPQTSVLCSGAASSLRLLWSDAVVHTVMVDWWRWGRGLVEKAEGSRDQGRRRKGFADLINNEEDASDLLKFHPFYLKLISLVVFLDVLCSDILKFHPLCIADFFGCFLNLFFWFWVVTCH